MKRVKIRSEDGRVGWVVLWLLGIPLPILLILFLVRGCTWRLRSEVGGRKSDGALRKSSGVSSLPLPQIDGLL